MDHVRSGAAAEFLWAVGIENTFVPQTRAGHRRLDEYELMGHYGLWRHDLDLAADLGVSAIRYGIPWYRVNPAPGRFDWSWTDEVLEYLVEVKGLVPIIDLMHYGTPLWLDNQFVNASYPLRVEEYAARFAERYRSLVSFYTPLNEPAVTANFCGRDGRWPPYLRGDDGYVKVLLALSRGICRTAAALRSARADTVLVHVEDVGLEFAEDEALASAVSAAQGRRLLPLDLACGRVLPDHPLYGWLLEHGATESDLLQLAGMAPRWDILGVNFYPWTNRRIVRTARGALRSLCGSSAASLADVLGMVHRRYRLPMMVTETSATGSHGERLRWMESTLEAVRQVRLGGVPVVGYTWFPLFTMVEWKYRWSRRRIEDHLLHLGLYEVPLSEGRLDRHATPMVEAYRRVIAAPADAIGAAPLAPVAVPGLVA